jgi:hypothetical protein
MHFANKDSLRIFLDQINLPVGIPVCLDFGKVAVTVSLVNFRLAITVGINRNEIFVFAVYVDPTVGQPISIQVLFEIGDALASAG